MGWKLGEVQICSCNQATSFTVWSRLFSFLPLQQVVLGLNLPFVKNLLTVSCLLKPRIRLFHQLYNHVLVIFSEMKYMKHGRLRHTSLRFYTKNNVCQDWGRTSLKHSSLFWIKASTFAPGTVSVDFLERMWASLSHLLVGP